MTATTHTLSVVGGGSWATALTKILSDNGHFVHWWMRDEDNIAGIRAHGYNPRYLRGARLSLEHIHVSSDLARTLAAADTCILAVPAAFMAETLRPVQPAQVSHLNLVSATKGMEPGTQLTISRYLRQRFGSDPSRLAVISGPCHAEEVAEDLPAWLTVGAENEVLGAKVAALLVRHNIRTASLTDTDGIETAAVLKNIYAIATGIAAGLGFGDNFRSVLVSSAAREMRDFLSRIAPGERDILHSVYIGDLLVTAYSQHSRNRTFGLMVGHGYNVRAAQLEMNMIAEGYYASRSVWEVCRRLGIELPIADAVYRILYEKVAPKLEFSLMMGKLG